jgi:hypothetical protein
MKVVSIVLLAASAAASPTKNARQIAGGIWNDIWSLVKPLLQGSELSISGPFAPVTPEILKDYIEPVNVSTQSLETILQSLIEIGTTASQQLCYSSRQQLLPRRETMDGLGSKCVLVRPG